VSHNQLDMNCHNVSTEFVAKEANGPFFRTITVREQLAFLRYVGTENDDVIFAVLVNGPDGNLVPGPQYEVARELFEASTAGTQI
jgi:hypothetical protein